MTAVALARAPRAMGYVHALGVKVGNTEQVRRQHASIDDLMADVFRTAATAGRQRCELLAAVLGLSRGYGDLSALEIATEAINIRGAAIRAAGMMGGRALVARYEFPVDASTRSAEDTATNLVAAYCMSQNERLRDRFFVADAVRDWANKRMHHDYAWWAQHLDRNQRHIEYRWAKRSSEAGANTVFNVCDRLLTPAMRRIEDMLDARGIAWRLVDE